MNIITSEAEQESAGEHERRRGTAGGRESAGTRGGRRARPDVYDVESCLLALSQLPVLVMMRIINPAQANVIRASLTELLRYYQHQENRGGGRSVADEDLQEIIRRDPRLLELLEPFLSKAQIDQLMQSGGEAADE